VSHLCLAAIDVLERGDDLALSCMLDAQREFLERHVQLWAPRCLELVAAAAGTLFYQGIAFLGQGVLAQPAIAIE
jgi:TorA maturation chaperone TorD